METHAAIATHVCVGEDCHHAEFSWNCRGCVVVQVLTSMLLAKEKRLAESFVASQTQTATPQAQENGDANTTIKYAIATPPHMGTQAEGKPVLKALVDAARIGGVAVAGNDVTLVGSCERNHYTV